MRTSWMKKLKELASKVKINKTANKSAGASRLKEMASPFLQKLKSKTAASTSQLKTNLAIDDWTQLGDLLLSPEFKPKWHKLFLATALITGSWGLGKSVGLLSGTLFEKKAMPGITPKIQVTLATPQEFDLFKQNDLFHTNVAPTNKVEGPRIDIAKIKCDDAEGRSSLPIKLINTIVLQDEIKSVASVQVRADLQEVRVGDEIDGLAKIEKIRRLQLVVKNLQNGSCELVDNGDLDIGASPLLLMPKPQAQEWKKTQAKIKGIESNGNSFKVLKSLLNEKMEDLGQVLTQAKGTPVQNADGSLSFVISDVIPGGVFSYLGITNGDTITHINGKKIQDLNEVMNLFGTIKSMDSLNLTVERGGLAQQMDYQFK